MHDPAAARLTVDLDAVAHNLAELRRRSGGAEVAPVLKSDAYGLGAAPIVRRLWAEGAQSFFVARLQEGEALRAALTAERPATIYVLDGMTRDAGSRLAAAGLTPVLCSLPQISAASAWAAGSGRPMSVAINLDTGMNRQGLTTADAQALSQAGDRLRHLSVDLVMSHLGSAADPENPRNPDQRERFRSLRAFLPEGRASLAASAGIGLGPDYHFDMVRPGVSLFGGGPHEVHDPALRAVATLTAPILDIRNLNPGAILGYGDSVRIDRPTRVAVVEAGYADGVIRAGRAGGYAWCGGMRCPLLIVNMDILVIAIGDAEVGVGETVELLGDNAHLDDLATAAGTVAHEVLVRLSRRADRVYLGVS